MLQAHYRSTLDFSNEALQASEKGLARLFEALAGLASLLPGKESSFDIKIIIKGALEALSDDLNSPIAIAHLFEGVRYINLMKEGKESLNESDLKEFRSFFNHFINDILGLKEEDKATEDLSSELMEILLELRKQAKLNKDYSTADMIRNKLSDAGIEIKDSKDGTEWKIS